MTSHSSYLDTRERNRTHDHNGRAIRRSGQDHAYGIDRGTPEDDGHLIEALPGVRVFSRHVCQAPWNHAVRRVPRRVVRAPELCDARPDAR